MKNNAIAKTLLSYRNAVFVPSSKKPKIVIDNLREILAVAVDFGHLGYTLSGNLIAVLRACSVAEIATFRNSTIELLKEVLGANVNYAPLFRKFPESVPNRDALLVSICQNFGDYGYVYSYFLLGHWSSEDYNGTWFGRQYPGIVLEDVLLRPELVSHKALKVLDVANNSTIQTIFENIIEAKGSISEMDKSFVSEFIKNNPSALVEYSLPETIPNKENLTYLIGAYTNVHGVNDASISLFGNYLKTATDVLRLAVAFSGSDVSLAEHTRFKLSNSQRKFVLTALDSMNYENACEDMLRFHGLWLVLAKYLHVSAYSDTYPNAAKMVDALRNSPNKINTFNRKIEALLFHGFTSNKIFNTVVDLLKTRPGDFARRLDHVLRLCDDKQTKAVADAFLSVVDKVATPLLLNLSTHIAHRDSAAKVRVYCPKGSTTNATVIRGESRDLLPSSLVDRIANGIDASLISRYGEKESLGNVYIDPNLQDILVPTSMRNISESLKAVARGSKFALDKSAKIVRLFLYWEDQKNDSNDYSGGERVDVDLSVMCLDDKFKQNGVVSYYNLNGKGITHSGDFTSAPNGASEFIDVDIDAAAKSGVRYLAVTTNVFTEQAFNTFTAKAGYMIRDGKTGKTFEAKSVDQKFDITAGTKFVIPMILDLKERKVIWMDTGFKDSNVCTNIGHKGVDLTTLAQYAVEMYREKSNLLELFNLHAKKRATSVSYVFDEKAKYDTILDMSMAGRVDEIMSNWI